ncbi:dTDP-Rha--alpha-D-GlcNAc-pyrophosphate polyprenol alpha-3-L-rhamnosyltransferase [Pseudomonas protegens]|uniref:glycosyltransferase family 2 protein n=1 Tax=Pseudomonas protegens TaxID=380021 RepID=UPI0002EFEF03|nr:glycosyltransferase family 2 protein [Pseudomonas protegens]ROM29404.1 dTDP-Rha--alpha-D-GlcNAc-pyrophosphate polyprenol alpha-3-L-rhamnosyltransferase [Pseudomonas protegens]ROM37037.1 dTDP-Rha--alpha-D-GlcNAc-pyrophosphate polyprenol alpha-3-L-rhamnosyltransferase [Pseudomonas protegens]
MPRSCDVVVVNYNAGLLLEDCVISVLAQDINRLVLVDNASHDGSLEQVATRFAADERLLILRNPSNTGFAAACNLGASHCEQPHILFLNPDTVLQPGALQGMIDALRHAHDLGMAGGLLCNFDGSEQPGGRRVFPTPRRAVVRALNLSGLAWLSPRLFSDFLLHREPLPSRPTQVEAISGACMLVKRKALDSVGGWDEGYFLHCEDLDLCMRFRQEGWKVCFVPQARIFHAWGACSRTRPVFVEWHKHRGMIRFYGKFFREDYPRVLSWSICAGVWLRFSFVVGYHWLAQLGRMLGQPR